MADDSYRIKNGVLSILKDLRQDFDHSFDQVCSDLLKCEEKNLRIDLGKATYVNSTYIGMIAATFFQGQTIGKTLTIQGQPSVIQVLRAAGFDGFIKLEVI